MKLIVFGAHPDDPESAASGPAVQARLHTEKNTQSIYQTQPITHKHP